MADSAEYFGRIEAAEFLEISTRTLDRYIRSKKLNLVRRNGKLFFSKSELESVKRGRDAQNPQFVSEGVVPFDSEEEKKYKILWAAAKEELQSKDQLLRDLHHRMGFLEAELSHSVPLLESQHSRQNLEAVVDEHAQKISLLKKKLVETQRAKQIFFFFSLLILTVFFLLLLWKNSF